MKTLDNQDLAQLLVKNLMCVAEALNLKEEVEAELATKDYFESMAKEEAGPPSQEAEKDLETEVAEAYDRIREKPVLSTWHGHSPKVAEAYDRCPNCGKEIIWL